MVKVRDIRRCALRIAREFKPRRIVLFGSYARGTATKDSDVDLLVILGHKGKSARKAAEILNKVDPPFPIDLLVRTPREIERRLAWNDFFIREVMREGKVLYAARNS